MSTIARALDTVYIYIYIYIYIVSFNLINHLYKHKAIFPYAFLLNAKMYM